MRFVIVVHGYYLKPVNEKVTAQLPNGISETKIVKKSPGDYIGGVCVYSKCKTLDEAKERAKEVWKDNFIGNVRQLLIRDENCNIMFTADNFNLLEQ